MLSPIAPGAQAVLVERYLGDLQRGDFRAAFDCINGAARKYYRNAENFASVYTADAYRIERFRLIGKRDRPFGTVFFVRETARYRDHAHDAERDVSATVPVGVVPENGSWRIKDPGHPWRAFETHATATSRGLRITVKKVSFFAHRIELVLTFANVGDTFVTLLPYAKTLLRDAGGTPYRIIETRDWSLTDRTLFTGLRLAPDAQYTGTLAFACGPLDDAARSFALTIAPALVDGGDLPFTIDVGDIADMSARAAR